MRNWLRTVLFISAFSPALLSLAYVRYSQHGWATEVVQLGIAGVLGCVIPVLVMRLLSSQGEVFIIQVKKVDSNDFMLMVFICSYLMPFVLKGVDLPFSTIAVILLVIGIVLWLISSLPAHPLLRFIRFRFYKIESSSGMVYTLITKREIISPEQIKSVKKISSSMLVEE